MEAVCCSGSNTNLPTIKMLDVEALLYPSSEVGTKEACAKMVHCAKAQSFTRRFHSLRCELFPRGSVESLQPYLCPLQTFHHSYGPVSVRNLQNPDLKLLVKSHGNTLRSIHIAPSKHYAHSAVSPKLQGCGYRALAKHCTRLKELALPIGYDVKKQLLPRIHVAHLERIILYDVPRSVTAKEIRAFVKRCPRLEALEVHGEALARFKRAKVSSRGLKRADGRVLLWATHEAKSSDPVLIATLAHP